MSHDVTSDALNMMMNAKKARKTAIEVKIKSKMLVEVLELMKKLGYVSYSVKGNSLEVELKEKLSECHAIKPRYSVKKREFGKYVRRFLPARDFGYILISTSKGIMTHYEAADKNLGGSLIAFVY